MTTANITIDRRAALKARHRQAILDAAAALIRERGKPRFSVDELAERADVARRTVFNHFSSLDDIVQITCTRVLTDAVDEFRAATRAAPTGGSRHALFSEIAAAVQGMDLPSVIAYLWGVLAEDGEDGRSESAMQNVFAHATDQLSMEIAGRSDELDQLEVEVLVSSLMNGVAVAARHWITRTGASLDPASRGIWDELLARLLASVRAGYAAPA
ncbi:TetR/AcrR family transcriptional regulator [Conyzicola sp.]|uniref:TetR/AcrR family transcriptional regulator n=1 Tax=Conyzicola sp. TaxID=1969404 RepID=UPI00398A2A43